MIPRTVPAETSNFCSNQTTHSRSLARSLEHIHDKKDTVHTMTSRRSVSSVHRYLFRGGIVAVGLGVMVATPTTVVRGQDPAFVYSSRTGEACRTLSRAVGTAGVHFELHTSTVVDGGNSTSALRDCRSECTAKQMDCLGFEYSVSRSTNRSRCELWNEIPTEFEQASSVTISEVSCHAKQYLYHTDSVCRTATGSSGSDVDPTTDQGEYYLYQEEEEADVMEACHQRCANLSVASNGTEDCYGFEINPDPTMRRCEVWRSPISSREVSSGRSCFVKPQFLTHQPSASPTQTPQPSISSSPTPSPSISRSPTPAPSRSVYVLLRCLAAIYYGSCDGFSMFFSCLPSHDLF